MSTLRQKQQIEARGAYCKIADLVALRFPARDLNLFSKRPSSSLLAGNVRTRFRGRGMDFEEVRLYQPGDDIRSIDWRVTARTQIPHTKLYSEERERPVHILCDQRASMFFGSVNSFKSVVAAHISAMLAWSALLEGDRVGGLVFGNQDFKDIRPKRNKHAVLQFLNSLEYYNHSLKSPVLPTQGPPNTAPLAKQTPKPTLTDMLADTRRIAKPGSAIFIVSDFYDIDDSTQEQLFQLGRHLDVTLIHIYDPIEFHLKGNGALAVTDGENQYQLQVGDSKFQAHYAHLADDRLQGLIKKAQQCGMELLQFSTADDITQKLRERFGRNLRRKAR